MMLLWEFLRINRIKKADKHIAYRLLMDFHKSSAEKEELSKISIL